MIARVDRALTRSQKKALGSTAARIVADPGCGATEVLARRFCQAVEQGRIPANRILVLPGTGDALDAFKSRVAELHRDGRRVLRSANIHTIHGFCSHFLHENALHARIDPGFSILGDARRRVMSGRLVDELGLSRIEDLSALGLAQDDDPAPVSECILALHRRAGDDPHTGRIADPLPFLESFERCCMELVAPVDQPDLWPERRIGRVKSVLPKMLLTAHRMAAVRDRAEFDWKALRKLRKYRGRLNPKSGFSALDQSLASARNAFDSFISACLDRQSALCADLLNGMVAEFGERYAAEKASLGLLDYDDLLSKASDLLSDQPEIALRYRDKYLLVIADTTSLGDEEQQIVQAVSRPDALFAVVSPDDGAKSIRLTESFRSHQGILDFAGFMIEKLWAEEPGPVHEPSKFAGSFGPSSDADVELIVVPRTFVRTEDSTARRHRTEANAIADRILGITGRAGRPPLMRSRSDVDRRPITLRDIVILLRSPFDLRVYERVLEDHGIPACAVGGRGFYDAPEVRDILNLLRAVNDVEDAAALASVLRSPFVGVRSPHIQSADDTDRQRVLTFWKLMDDLIALRDRTSVLELLDTALYGTQADLKLLAMRDGLRKYANVRKFRELVRESGHCGLREFLARMEESERFGSRESEAPVHSPDEDVVRIMTVYQAGELQAPVVFVGDLSRRWDPEPGIIAFDPDRGLAVRPPSLKGRIEIPLGYREIGEVVENKAALESKHLFRTALTRAEERLILVGSSGLTGEYKSTYRETISWMGWIEKAFLLGQGTHRGDHNMGGCKLAVSFAEPRMSRSSRIEPPATLSSRFAREYRDGQPIESPPTDSKAFQTVRDAIRRCLAEAPTEPRRITRLSVSQALDYIECPARYRFRYVIGIPDATAEPPDDPQEAEFSAADLGQAVHDILSRIDFAKDTNPQVERLISGVPGKSLRAEAEPLVRRFMDSRWRGALLTANEVLQEVPFEFVVGGKVIAGRIDALYRTGSGWTVLDYKTGQAEDRERYELQVGVYALAIHRLLGEMPSRAALVLLTLDDEWVQDTSDGSAARSASERIGEVTASVDAGRFDPISGHYCRWCSFSSLCTKE